MKSIRLFWTLLTVISIFAMISCDPAGNDLTDGDGDKTETGTGKEEDNKEDGKEDEGKEEGEGGNDEGGNTEGEEQEKPKEAQFKIKVYDVSSISATVEVEPVDATAPYYTDILPESDFNQTLKYGFDDYMKWLLESMSKKHGKTTAEVIEMISSHGNDGFIMTTLEPESVYYAVAVGIDETGMTSTDVVYEKFTTLKEEESVNTFTISAHQITTNSAKLKIETDNNDPYIFAIESKGNTEGLTDKELTDYIIQSNMAWGGLDQMTYTGTKIIDHVGMAGWEYEAIAFGYNDGSVTTEVVRLPFKMEEGGDPAACRFEFAQDFDTFEMHLSVTPSDNSVVYVSNIIKKSDLDVLMDIHSALDLALGENLEMMIEELIEDCETRARVMDIIVLMESQQYTLKFEPGTEYVQWAVPVNQDGTLAASFSVSEAFKAPEEEISDAALTVKNYTVYDGSELAVLYPDEFKGAKGYAVVDLIVEPDGQASKWWSYIVMEDLSNRSRETIIKNVQMAPTQPNLIRQLIIAYWGTNTIFGVAQDSEGVYGPLLLQIINLDKNKVTPATQLKF